jgi:adenylate cyclase
MVAQVVELTRCGPWMGVVSFSDTISQRSWGDRSCSEGLVGGRLDVLSYLDKKCRGGRYYLTAERVERRLAAVLAADVAGYSKLMGEDELSTLSALKTHRREVIDPAIARHNGRLVKTTGDGMLVEFASAVDAVTCAMSMQQEMAERSGTLSPKIVFRIGINIGDLIIDGEDIFGDGVNVAARVEGECEPGGVCLSESAYEQVRGKTNFRFDDLGERSLKNIHRPVRLYAVRSAPLATAIAAKLSSEGAKPLPLPDKPSIAVLPFDNMSGDPDQEYFADGMVEDIITALSRFKWLFVIARNSSFTFKGKAVDIKEVGRKLGVRYVLEGSVRKSGGRVRITGQLIDAVTGAHLWADKFEQDLTDVFALQDEVTIAVISAIHPKLLETEIDLATRRPIESLTAYDLYLRARKQLYRFDRDGHAEALRLCQQALEIDPGCVLAAAFAAGAHVIGISLGFTTDYEFHRKEAIRLTHLALSIDENDEGALATAGWVNAYFIGDYETALDFADRSVARNPNDARAWRMRGWTYKAAGQYEEAVQSLQRCVRSSPLDPTLHNTLSGIAQALIELRRFDEAVAISKKALRQNATFSATHRAMVAALIHLGRDVEACQAVARLLEVDPTFAISAWLARGGNSNSPLLIEGLRRAGLPE